MNSRPFFLTLSLFFLATFALAQETKDQNKAGRRKQKTTQQAKTLTSKSGDVARRPVLSKSQQVSAIAFAKANHPELVPLLNSLKRTREADYNRELRQLYQASTRLGKLKSRVQVERYEQELTVWKLDSRIRLQLAKWAVSKDSKLEAEIRNALAERQAIRKAQYERELAQLNERQAKLQSMLKSFTGTKLDKEWEQLSKSVARKRRQPSVKKRPSRPATKPAKDKTKKKDAN